MYSISEHRERESETCQGLSTIPSGDTLDLARLNLNIAGPGRYLYSIASSTRISIDLPRKFGPSERDYRVILYPPGKMSPKSLAAQGKRALGMFTRCVCVGVCVEVRVVVFSCTVQCV